MIVSKVGVVASTAEAAVLYRGVQVGQVEPIRFDHADRRQILIDVSVAPETWITNAHLGPSRVAGLDQELAFVELADDREEGTRLSTRPLETARIEMRRPRCRSSRRGPGPARAL